MEKLAHKYDEVTAEDRQDEYFQLFWSNEKSLSEIADQEGKSRQWISQKLQKRSIRTYHNYRYPPRGVTYRWSFAEDTFLLTAAEKSLPLKDQYQDLVEKIGPVETAKVLEAYEYGRPDDTHWSDYLTALKTEGVRSYPEAWEDLRRQINIVSAFLWKAVQYTWENWERALEQDPLPRWVLNRAMDDLEMTQSEFSKVIGFQPRTIRKWTNRGSSSKPCTGINRLQIYWRLKTYLREEEVDEFLPTYAQVVVDKIPGFFESAYELLSLFFDRRREPIDP